MAHCRFCKSREVVKLSSVNQVLCNACKRYTTWELEEGEQSVLIEGVTGGVQGLLPAEDKRSES